MNHYELMAKVASVFPNALIDMDVDGQYVIHTNLYLVTPQDNPAIPEGEHIIVDMDSGE